MWKSPISQVFFYKAVQDFLPRENAVISLLLGRNLVPSKCQCIIAKSRLVPKPTIEIPGLFNEAGLNKFSKHMDRNDIDEDETKT